MPDFLVSDNTPSTFWDKLVGTPLMIIGIVIVALFLRWLTHRAIRKVTSMMEQRSAEREQASGRAARVLRQAAGLDNERRKQRAATLGSLLRSVSTLIIFTIAALTIMAELGVPLAPLLASAGVGGVALGFGAQSLVKDFLSGVFMILEDQYGVGDVIDTGEAIGTVEEVTLRITRLRDANGVVWYVRNGEIVRIGNRSQGWSVALVDVPVAYDQSVEKALDVLRTVAEKVDDDSPWKEMLLEEPQVAGVESVSGGVVTLRIIAKTLPGQQYAISRELRERSKVALDAAGVRGPSLPPYGSGGSTGPAGAGNNAGAGI
ncbi:mechanosensitive ion channel family protein [Yimella sp. cx-51]|uniref:mechanosensitive ion channel family protein n=1 Tax=Yimella sp. cx-51 TaxID=2770551 RepID=UPI00165DB341|nr:mechanosensitive ion channel family protein [Yimella sp. cx-51]MBC9957127.1 mechanosensitive ion channel family protein [Yimella sp. cx-51]MBD2758438.1 mechanosensitive ion channel family protein [Yimella sp. cx-573]QTH37218.1 mechanosensitive ion channel family protein [Yimella sp. cx-51]